MSIRFDGKVAIVTGAGNGLGRSHALGLAARGAKVVVNDLGGSVDGCGGSSDAAKSVVAEIETAGGEAIANGANVTDMAQVSQMVDEAMAKWGRVDILVNNAGVLRDKSFSNVEMKDFAFVLDVHLMGSVNCSKAVWNIMREQGYGRIAMTTSSSGLYGNFGQTNYGAAKMGVIGLMNTLVIEGAKYGIKVNALSPCAATRMTEDIIPENLLELLTPESVTPALLYIVSEDSPNRTIITAGAGTYARSIVYETGGKWLAEGERTPEKIAEHWGEIADPATQLEYTSGNDQTTNMLTKAANGLGIKL
ncbi:SDR family NAD(P)-dependent oxidoreductase [uncultured Sneathiella sp.]|jgi:NAD(P)-dependent dehydrogenase (short-subunit alcohol dehydrogenase family)|uniref:SDR family NAD(P)-dependent oxidoreductase n=1 Tax=uncultured Sneathiella sp. TaxID=879315 RepID=UPI0030DDA5C1|tara:strand:- start:1493 stop:2410 length:918 start_codon:yes stop_codon:yes gene_type:complete